MILNLMNSHPLAMMPEKVIEIKELLEDRKNGIRSAVGELSVEKKVKKPVDKNGIATYELYGSMAKRMNLIQQSSGGISTEIAIKDIKALLADEKVKGILLDIDSPGGSVFGVNALSLVLSEATKPVVAFSSGLMASAAYWVASASDYIVVDETSTIGSIGVVTVHTDVSEMNKESGITKTVLTAGKYKASGNQNEPLSEESRDEIQSKLDTYYKLFVNNVSKNRNINSRDILKVADGKSYVGCDSPAELVDAVGGMEIAYNKLVELIKGEKNMNLEEFKASEEYASLLKDHETALSIERQRCVEILSIEGEHFNVKLEAVKSGLSVSDVYAELYKAEVASKSDEKSRLEDLTKPADTAVSAPVKVEEKLNGEDFKALIEKHKAAGEKRPVLKAMQENPELHKAYVALYN